MRTVVVEERFRAAARTRRTTGALLLAAAGILMAYAAWQLFTPYTTDGGTPCHAPFVDVGSGEADETGSRGWREGRADPCVTDGRQWPGPVAALLVALPLTAVGTAKFTSGSLALALRHHEADLQRAEP